MKSGFCKIGWALAAALLAWNVVAADNLFSDLMVARGKGVEVRRGQLDDAFIAYKANLAARKQELPEERRTQVEAMLLDRIMITQLLTNRASELDRTKARDNALKFLENTRKTVESEDACRIGIMSGSGSSRGWMSGRIQWPRGPADFSGRKLGIRRAPTWKSPRRRCSRGL